jgi:uncharacterized protein YjbI with pentapeptide repeats
MNGAPDGPVGIFAGKVVFGSTGATPVRYLTAFAVKRPGKDPLWYPGMAAVAATPTERCILYQRADGSIALQLANLMWVALDERFGWLTATTDPTQAASLTLGGSPRGTSWTVATSGGQAAVSYTVGSDAPLLTINGGVGAYDTFAPTLVTPSLAAIATSKSCPEADLVDVDLRGAVLDTVNLHRASLDRAQLDGAKLTSCTLDQASFDGATLGSLRLDGAVLDSAHFVGADMAKAAWGTPKSAKAVVLTDCHARGAVLGGPPPALDCGGATLSGGDFRGADLRTLSLPGAAAQGALLSGCRLDNAVLDGADLTGAIADGATLTFASLRGTIAQAASFARADLSHADLTRVRMGAKAWLFTVPAAMATDLDTKPYAQPALVTAFANSGVRIRPEDPVRVVTPGQRWQITDPRGLYDLLLNQTPAIDVFNADPNLRPAVLRGAVCLQTTASGASLAGADLRGVLWHAKPATLAHADLEDTALNGAYLAGTDFTQARVAGTDLSDTVLVGSLLRGCVCSPGSSKRAVSLEGALVHGTDFTSASLLTTLLVDAAVSTERGVPLFRLPLSARANLTNTGLPQLAPLFDAAERPLGSGPTVTQIQQWLLDNSADPTPGMPRGYRVRPLQGKLAVYDTTGGTVLFYLPMSQQPALQQAKAPQSLVDAFAQAGQYTLVLGAPITPQPYWDIVVGSDAPVASVATYGRLRVFADPDALPVYGAVLVTPHAWPTQPDALAFGPTVALEAALNPQSIGPNGTPRAWYDEGLITFDELLTAAAGQP